MPRKSSRVAYAIALATTATLSAGEGESAPLQARTRTFDVSYAVNEAALPLDSVELWVTADDGRSWSRYGVDEDRQSPIAFRAPGEGQFGLYFVVTNAAGASSAPPSAGTEPHRRVVVDFTPPVVQLHPPRATTVLGERVVQVRWTAIDAQLAKRPIRIEYRIAPDDQWKQASNEPLANTGRYDWRVPADVALAATLRVCVSDLGGHRVYSGEQEVEFSGAESSSRRVTSPTDAPTLLGAANQAQSDSPQPRRPLFDDSTLPGSRRARTRVERLIAEAEEHGRNGEYALGVARLREAVRLDPQMTDAFLAMADMLHGVGDLDRSLNAYDIALKQRPGMRDALLGSAQVLREQKSYGAAAERLRTILRYNAKDAETWMNLGDVAIFQGDELLARECYTRASQIDPEKKDVIADAKQRLALMRQSSTSYRASSN